MFSSQGYLHFFPCGPLLGTLAQYKNQFYAISQVFSKVKVCQNHLEGWLFILNILFLKKKNQMQRHFAKINLVLPYSIAFIQKHLISRFKCSFSSSFVHLLLPFSLYLPRLVIKGNWQVLFSLSSGTLDDFQKEGSFPGDSVVENPPTNAEDAGDSGSKTWVGKIRQRRVLQPTSVFLAGKFHGQRSLAACSP